MWNRFSQDNDFLNADNSQQRCFRRMRVNLQGGNKGATNVADEKLNAKEGRMVWNTITLLNRVDFDGIGTNTPIDVAETILADVRLGVVRWVQNHMGHSNMLQQPKTEWEHFWPQGRNAPDS